MSSLTWLDYSEHDRRKALDVIDLFGERDTRDELGLGTIRDGFADLYFGDYDPKGLQIPDSAMADIRAWVDGDVDLRFTRCGISPEHTERFSIPEKIENPGTYEWEALTDGGAEIVIMESLATIVDVDRITAKVEVTETETVRLQNEVQEKLAELLAA